jgi:hypothetical protein
MRRVSPLGNSSTLNITSLAFGCLIVYLASSVHGQTSFSPDNGPSQAISAEDSSDTESQVPPSTLQGINDNASSVNFMDREHGPVNFGFELRGGWSDNLFDTSLNTKSTGSYVAGVPVGVRWRGNTSDLSVNYRIDSWQYPRYSSINSLSQTYQHQWKYRTSDVTSYFWDGSAGRVASLGQYLPVVIAIGSTGVAQSSVGGNVLENSYITTSAASAAGFLHELSEHDSISGIATAAWIEEAQRQPSQNQHRAILRSEPAGLDFRFDHEASLKTSIGAEVTNLYIRGLAPSGHLDLTTTEASYGYKFTPAFTLLVDAGPLFNLTSGTSDVGRYSYSASATVSYITPAARISASYAHVLQLGYIAPATTAHQVSILFDRALNRSLELTVDGRYVRASADLASLRQSNFGITAVVVRRLTSRLALLLNLAQFQQTNPATLGDNMSFASNQFSVGITYVLGDPLVHEGVR